MTTTHVTLGDLWDHPRPEDVPWLDRPGAKATNAVEADWQRDGLVILPGFMPEDRVDAYCRAFQGGWGIGTPYLESSELRDVALYAPLVEIIGSLVGEPVGLHLNLTWWRSTERDWHQDDYLNPPYVNGHYAASWVALADIHPDSGPFEFLRGTHRWPLIRQAKVLEAMGEDGSDPDWPWRSEALLTPLVEAEIERRGLEPEAFVARKGDVLIWHGRLLHRGSRPKVPGMERRSLISHYSGIFHRHDMPRISTHNGGGRYFVL